MNKGYTYIDGKVVISDENGNHTQSEYYDNLNEVLVQENVIEKMEEKIKELTKENEKNSNAKKRYIPKHLYLYIMLGCALATAPLFWILTGVNPYISNVDTVFGSVNRALIYTSVVVVSGMPCCVLMTIDNYRNYRNKVNIGNGISSELEFLKLQLEKEKENLISLKRDKTRYNEDKEIKSFKVDDKQRLEALRSYLVLYNDLGYNREKYYRYYKQGKLDYELQKHYSENEIKLAKEYLEENGPVLAKKRSNNK